MADEVDPVIEMKSTSGDYEARCFLSQRLDDGQYVSTNGSLNVPVSSNWSGNDDDYVISAFRNYDDYGQITRIANCIIPDDQETIDYVVNQLGGEIQPAGGMGTLSGGDTAFESSLDEIVITATGCDDIALSCGGSGSSPSIGWGWGIFNTGGSSDPSDWGGSGGGQPNPPEYDLPPEPCDAEEEAIHPAFAEENVMEVIRNEVIEKSNFSGPKHERVEQGFFITEEGGTFEVVPFSGPVGTPCRLKGGFDSVPSNIVAVGHTHPFSEDESVTDELIEVCPTLRGGYRSGPSTDDLDFFEEIKESLADYGLLATDDLEAFVLDKDNISRYDEDSEYDEDAKEYSNVDFADRCGYRNS